MIKPNFVGPKSFYLNPTIINLSTAEIAAIDTVFALGTVSPFAYTATVRDNYDTKNFFTDNAGSDLAADRRLAVGLFLSADNEKKNLLFQVSGKVIMNIAAGTAVVNGSFFIGRKATNNTVVSDLTAPQNTLAQFTLLPSQSGYRNSTSTSNALLSDSIQSDVFALQLDGGFVWCFGYMLDNPSAATAATGLRGTISLAFRKYNDPLDVYRVSG